MHKHPYEVIIL